MNTLPQPTTQSLLLACLTSFIVAAIVFIVAVLPAEFNIDPTGLGKALGLTVLAQTDKGPEKEAIISCPETEQTTESNSTLWQDTVIITVPAKKGLEYKFYVKKGEQLEFVWKTEGEKLYFDFHGEPEADKTGYFKSFKESKQNESSGTLTAPFSGSHGWYWKNNSTKAVNITLKTRGQYQIKGLM